jgi:hypothetical protein
VAAPLQLRCWSIPVMTRTLTIAAVLKAPFGLASEASRFAWESLATTAAVVVLLASGERDRICAVSRPFPCGIG